MTDGLEPEWEIRDEVHRWTNEDVARAAKALETACGFRATMEQTRLIMTTTWEPPSWWRHPIRRLRVWWWSR